MFLVRFHHEKVIPLQQIAPLTRYFRNLSSHITVRCNAMFYTLGDQFHFNAGITKRVIVYPACKKHYEAFRKLLQNAVPQDRRKSHSFRNSSKVLFPQLSPIFMIKRVTTRTVTNCEAHLSLLCWFIHFKAHKRFSDC